MKRITLVRHGQSEANVTGHWQGHGDSPLSPLGRDQAAALGVRFARRGWHFDRCVSSDLVRASATAEASAERMGLTVTHSSRFREIDVGAWEGLSRPEVRERFPEQIAALQRGEDVAIGGAESWLQLAARAEQAVGALRDEMADGEHVAVFAHGGFIASVVARLCAISRDRPARLGHMSNTSVTTLAFEGDAARVRMHRFNDTAHLGGVGAWAKGRLEDGATVVSLLSRTDDETESHAWYERGPELTLGVDVDAPDIATAVTGLQQRFEGQRVALRVDVEPKAQFLEQVLNARGLLHAPTGVSHVVAEGSHRVLADYNIGQ